MPDIHLLIPDAAVREAVVEQITAAKIGVARAVDTAQTVAAARPRVIVVDEAAYDAKAADLWQGLADRPAVLLLGGGEVGDDVAESFAKPFRLGHLMTRIAYYLETAPLLRDRIVTFGDYRLEVQNRRAINVKTGDSLRLTEKETALLVFLADNAQPVMRREILAGVWGYGDGIDTHTLETHIYQLRRKLGNGEENGGDWLVSENGGYRLARGGA